MKREAVKRFVRSFVRSFACLFVCFLYSCVGGSGRLRFVNPFIASFGFEWCRRPTVPGLKAREGVGDGNAIHRNDACFQEISGSNSRPRGGEGVTISTDTIGSMIHHVLVQISHLCTPRGLLYLTQTVEIAGLFEHVMKRGAFYCSTCVATSRWLNWYG